MRYALILLLFTSCNLMSDGNDSNISQSVKESYYSGYLRVNDSITNNFQEGNYLNGFKKGKWIYNIKQVNYTKNWTLYEELENLKVNIPLDWEVLNDEIVQFSAKGETFLNDSAQIVIYQITIDTLKYKLEDYRGKFNQDLANQWDLLEESEECFLNSNDEFLISKYHLKKKEKDYFCFSLIMIIDGEILDISYYFKSTNWKRHYNMFFDFINGLKVNDKFLTNHEFNKFNPLGFYLCE